MYTTTTPGTNIMKMQIVNHVMVGIIIIRVYMLCIKKQLSEMLTDHKQLFFTKYPIKVALIQLVLFPAVDNILL